MQYAFYLSISFYKYQIYIYQPTFLLILLQTSIARIVNNSTEYFAIASDNLLTLSPFRVTYMSDSKVFENASIFFSDIQHVGI